MGDAAEGGAGGGATPVACGAALPRDVARVLAWVRGHPRERPGLDALARVGGVPPRTLEDHFERFLGTTPLRWARDERLARARRALGEPGDATTVSQVAVDCGFPQLGRFAAAYARRYGELPSETLRAARRACADGFAEGADEASRLVWRAIPSVFAVAPRSCGEALEDLERAQALAPAHGLAKAAAAWCYGQRAAQHFAATPREDSSRALALAGEACRLAPDDALVLSLASGAYTLAHRLDDAGRLLDRAVALDPASPWVWVRRAWAAAYAGDAEGAVRGCQTTLHLMPFEPIRHLALIGAGAAHFVAGRYERAARWAQAGIEASPESYWAARVVAASALLAGAREEARGVVRLLRARDPSLTVEVARRAWPFPRTVMERLSEGLAGAGLPRE